MLEGALRGSLLWRVLLAMHETYNDNYRKLNETALAWSGLGPLSYVAFAPLQPPL